MKNKKTTTKPFKLWFYVLNVVIFCLAFYVLLLPVYPVAKYEVISKYNFVISKLIKHDPQEDLLLNDKTKPGHRIVIKKINVEAPIIQTSSAEHALWQGAWLDPAGQTPDEGGNTIITGHRFKYLPPSNLTFYLLHKLEIGDPLYIVWDNKVYKYKVKLLKIVEADDASILAQTKEDILTIYTCHPIFSQSKRLVVIGEKI